MYRLMPILVAVLLGACAAAHTPEEEDAARAALAAADEATCKSYGLHPGTREFDDCMTKLDDQRARADTNDRAGRLLGRPPSWATF